MSEWASQQTESYITIIGALAISLFISEYLGMPWDSPWIIAVLCFGGAVTYVLYRVLSWIILYIISGGKLY